MSRRRHDVQKACKLVGASQQVLTAWASSGRLYAGLVDITQSFASVNSTGRVVCTPLGVATARNADGIASPLRLDQRAEFAVKPA